MNKKFALQLATTALISLAPQAAHAGCNPFAPHTCFKKTTSAVTNMLTHPTLDPKKHMQDDMKIIKSSLQDSVAIAKNKNIRRTTGLVDPVQGTINAYDLSQKRKKDTVQALRGNTQNQNNASASSSTTGATRTLYTDKIHEARQRNREMRRNGGFVPEQPRPTVVANTAVMGGGARPGYTSGGGSAATYTNMSPHSIGGATWDVRNNDGAAQQYMSDLSYEAR